MVKGIEKEQDSELTVFKDSIITGVLHALGHEVNPQKNPDGQIEYKIHGDVPKTIEEIYANCPVGALDVMKSIKMTRSMIFNLRGSRHEK